MTNTNTTIKARDIHLRDLEYLVGPRCYIHIIGHHFPEHVELIDFNIDDGMHRFNQLADYLVVYIIPADDKYHVEIGIYEDKI